MPDPVVITRPAGQAGTLAQGIAAAGREVILFPLLEIQPLPDYSALEAALSGLPRYAMAAFVSPNAIDEALSRVTAWPADVAIAVMGQGSRAALARHGITSANATIFSPVDSVRTDSQTLIEALDLEWLRRKKVLVIRGESGRELLADTLRMHGAQVDQVAAYRRGAPAWDESKRALLSRLLAGRNDWIVTSSEAMRNLLDITEKAEGAPGVKVLQQQAFYVPHIRIKENAERLGFKRLILTGSGDAGLLAALQWSL